jgi:hypothetical protein
LQRNIPKAGTPSLSDLKLMFSRFIDQHRQSTGGQAMTQ